MVNRLNKRSNYQQEITLNINSQNEATRPVFVRLTISDHAALKALSFIEKKPLTDLLNEAISNGIDPERLEAARKLAAAGELINQSTSKYSRKKA
jgi:hypothetical protein